MLSRSNLFACIADASQDLHVAVRRLQRTPAVAAGIVLTIALGLGAAAAIFATSKAALVEPLPYIRPDRLVHLWEVRGGSEERSPTAFPTLGAWRARSRSFTGFEGYDPINVTVGVADGARMLRGARVTPGFFRLLGVPPAEGRFFAHDNDAAPETGVAVVSARFARANAGGRALDEIITINGVPHLVIGTLPETFHFALLQNADVFLPVNPSAAQREDWSNRSIHVVARLRDGTSLPAARADLAAVMTGLARQQPDALIGRSVIALSLRDAFLGSMKVVLQGLLGAIALLLLIMAANLALLMLAQYAERTPELALRSVLGATRGRVLRQLLAESLLPCLLGAGIAVFVGQVATQELLKTIPENVRIGTPYLARAGLDATVVGVIFGVAIVLEIGFVLGPALLAMGTESRMRNGWATGSRGNRRVRQALVTGQFALTIVLLISSGMLVLSFGNLVRRDLGFRSPETIVAARAPLSVVRYGSAIAQQQFYEALVARTAALPGVSAAGVVNEVPGGGGGFTTFEPVDLPRRQAEQARILLRIADDKYFSTMGVPIVAGRSFDSHDRTDAPRVAVVSAALAKLLAEDGATIGRGLRLAGTGQIQWEVIGVVGDVQASPLDTESPPVLYVSHLQLPENRMTLVLRTELSAAAVGDQVREIVKSMDPGVPVYAITALDAQLAQSRAVFSRRLPMILFGVFGIAALALTLVALYAMCLNDVVARRRELGIRLALGEAPSSIRRLILKDTLALSILGIGVGTIAAVLVTRSLQGVLFGTAPTDWRVYSAVSVGALACAVVATLGPVMRAGSISLGALLRGE